MTTKPKNRPAHFRAKRSAILAASIATIFALCLVPTDAHAQLYITQYDNNLVSEYNAATGAAINSSFITGLNGPAGLTVSGNILFVANFDDDFGANGGTTVGTYNASTGAVIKANFITGLTDPWGLALSGNNLFVSNVGSGGAPFGGTTVGKYNASTGVAINASFVTGLQEPNGLAVSGNNLYVANYAAGTIGEYNATTGVAMNTSFVTGLNTPGGLAVSGNDLFVANYGGGSGSTVGEYNATTGVAINASFITGLDGPTALAVSGNNLFVVNWSSGAVGEYNATTGAAINSSFITGLINPAGIAIFSSASAPATYWLGGTDGTWTGNNWASDATGTPTTAIPASADDITFSATGGANETTTLGQNFTIHSLTISDPAAVTIGSGAGGPFMLTISGNAGTGINVQSGAGLFTLNANLTLAGSSDTITVDNTAGAVINGVVGGSNGLNVNGTGTLTLANASNSYTGGTTVSNGTLQIGTTGSVGSIGAGAVGVNTGGTLTLVNVNGNTLANNVTNGVGGIGTLNINSANNNTITGTLSDGAAGQLAVTQSGTGTTTLSGTNTYSGATTVGNGVLQAGSTQAFGIGSAVTLSGGVLDLHGFSNSIGSLSDGGSSAGVVDNTAVGAASLTVGAATASTIFSGTIQNTSGPLSLNYQGRNGVFLVLTGSNTYTGTTTINAGAIEAGSNNALGTSSVVVNSGGTLSLLSGVNVGNALTISGNGATFLGAPVGALVVNQGGNTATYSGAITLSGNALISPDAGTLTLSGGITKNGFTLTFGPVNGAGNVIINTVGIGGAAANSDLVADTNTVTENVANTYRGGTWITNGGTLNANVANALPTAHGRSAVTMDPAAAIPNSTAASPSTGGSTLALGASQSIASLAGATTSKVNIGANTLTIGFGTGLDTTGTANANFSGVISGAGGLTKDETSTQILSGANTYTGTTTVNGGALEVDGSIASLNTIVNAGGTLQGVGTVGGSVTNSGTVQPDAPAASGWKLTLGGNYTQTSGGNLRINIASATNYGQLIVGGTASLNGTLTAVAVNGFHPVAGQTFTFLTATGGVSGRFSTLNNQTGGTGTLLQLGVTYGPTSATLALTQGPILLPPGSPASSFALSALSPNQGAVAGAIDGALFDPRMGKILAYLDSLPLGAIPGALDRISPADLSAYTSVANSLANIETINLQLRLDALRSGSNGFSAEGFHIAGSGPDYAGTFGVAGPTGPDGKESKDMVPPPNPRLGVFLTGVGEWVNVGNTENARGYDLAAGGFTLGVDYKFTPHLALGLSVGYDRTGVSLSNGGNLIVDGGKLGLYGTYFTGGFYVDAAVTGGLNGYDSRRAALQGDARGRTNGGELDTLLGTGYTFKVVRLSFGPTANFQYTHMGVDGFTENGSLAPLKVGSQSTDSLRTALGFKASYEWHVGGVVITPQVRAAWQHEFGETEYAVDSSFANGAGDTFTVDGPRIGRDSALLGAGFTILWNDRVSTYVYYDGELGRRNYQSNSVSGGIRVAF